MRYIIFIMLFLTGCCKPDCTDPTNPECSNYDRCYNIREPSGKILRSIGRSEIWSDSFGDFDMGDTILFTRSGGNNIAVYCPDTGCTYEWTIGSEKITEQGFFRQNVPANVPIEVTLKVTLKDPKNCISADKRVKITKRTFYGVQNFDGKIYNYYGRWKGYYTDNPSKEVIVEFKTDKDNGYIELSDRIPVPPYCRDKFGLSGYVDTITNVPAPDDELYIGRHEDYTSNDFTNLIIGGEYKEINCMYNLASTFTKKICSYNPIYQPSIQVYLPDKNKIQIDIQAVPSFNAHGYKANDIIFKRSFIGRRI